MKWALTVGSWQSTVHSPQLAVGSPSLNFSFIFFTLFPSNRINGKTSIMKQQDSTLVPDEVIISKIYVIRGQKVMIDRDLAELFGVATKVLKQTVKRNMKRFPEDFMFEMVDEEFRQDWFALCSILFYGTRCHNAFVYFEQPKSNCCKYSNNSGCQSSYPGSCHNLSLNHHDRSLNGHVFYVLSCYF